MKTKATIFFLLVCCVLSSVDLNAQDNTPIITLVVDTEKVNQNNIEETCSFGQPADVSVKDFTLEVNKGDVILWRGTADQDSSGLVRITEFRHESGTVMLGKRRITDQNGTGVVVGKVMEGDPGDVEVYYLKFEVKRGGGQDWEEFIIDPKLKLM